MNACRKAVALVATTALAVAIAGCSDSGASSGQFVSRIDTICRGLNSDLGDLSKPTAQDEVRAFATDASDLFLAAVKRLKALQVPAASSQVSDAKALVSKLDHLVDVLDDIATAAKAGNDSTVSAKAAEFESVRSDIADLADSLNAGHCDLDAQFDELAAPVTTTAPTTVTTAAPTDGSNKSKLQLTGELVPAGGLSFADVTSDLLDAWLTVVQTSPTAAAMSGGVAGVEVSSNGTLLGRVFVFVADEALPTSVIDDLVPTLSNGAAAAGETVNGFPGVSWTSTDGVVAFLGAQQSGSAKFFLYAVSPSHDGMVAIVTGLWASLPN